MSARRVLDVACGTGRHAALFHSWGLHVEGADVNPRMIAAARGTFQTAEDLRWVVRAFDAPVQPEVPFDVALCVGNSLALAPDQAAIQAALCEMLTAVRRGGLAIVQVLNLWHLAEGPCLWQKSRRVRLANGDAMVVKGVHRVGSRGYVDLVVVPLAAGVPLHTKSIPFLGIDATDLECLVAHQGARDVVLYGDYHDGPYDRERSGDLIMVATK